MNAFEKGTTPPNASDLEGWKRLTAAKRLAEIHPEALVTTVQTLGPAGGPLRTPRCPRTAPRPRRPHPDWPCSRRRRIAIHQSDTLCRTQHRTESSGSPSLWHVTPSVASEHSAELLGYPISGPRYLLRLDLTRFGGQFVVSLSDSLPSSNV